MRRKIGSFMNMAAEIGGRGGKGGMVHGVRSLGRFVIPLLVVPCSSIVGFDHHQFRDIKRSTTNVTQRNIRSSIRSHRRF